MYWPVAVLLGIAILLGGGAAWLALTAYSVADLLADSPGVVPFIVAYLVLMAVDIALLPFIVCRGLRRRAAARGIERRLQDRLNVRRPRAAR